MTPCETCGGTRVARYEDKTVPGAIGGEGCGIIVCSDCSVVVSKSDAEDLKALREIEKDGLACWFSGNGFWHVAEDEDEPPAEKHATSTILAEALAEYRRKKKN